MKKFTNATSYVIYLLSRREYSVYELKQKLKEKEFTQAQSDQAIEDVITRGWQSDLRYIESMFMMKTSSGFGKIYIIQKLKQKGISSNLISEFLETFEYDWFELAKNVFHQKFDNLDLTDIKNKQKVYRFMCSRGFSSSEFIHLMDINYDN